MVSTLLAANAYIHATVDKTGWNALHFCCACSSLKRKVGEGVAILHPQSSPDSAMEDISNCKEDSLVTLETLLKNGIYPNIKTVSGKTALAILADNSAAWGLVYLKQCVFLLTSYGEFLPLLCEVSSTVYDMPPSTSLLSTY